MFRYILKIILVISVVIGFNACLVSDVLSITRDAGQAARYLRMGIGARALGMAGAYVAVVDDATACYWNPAGLMQLDRKEIQAMYSVLSIDRKYNFLNYVQPVNKDRVFGISIVDFRVEDIEGRSKTGGTEKVFEDIERAIIVSYAGDMDNGLLLGANLKYIYQSMNPQAGKHSAKGIGMDMGMLWKPNDNVGIGLVLQDIGSSLKWDTGRKDNLPIVVKLGVAYWLMNKRLLTALDLEKVAYTTNIRLRLGGEYKLNENVWFRVGLVSAYDTFPTAGLSFKFPLTTFAMQTVQIDYSFAKDTFTDFDDAVGYEGSKYNHRISLGIRF